MPRALLDEPACCVCGCTQFNACEGGCSWVAADLCSACDPYWKAAVGTTRKVTAILGDGRARSSHLRRRDLARQAIARAMRQVAEEVYGDA